MATMWFILIIIALCIVWGLAAYNGFVQLKNLVDEAWSGIDVQLKRRYDLIPNLVATVKQYSKHEKETFENIAQMRSQAMKTTDIKKRAAIESNLTESLRTVFAVAENYPELKANQNFLDLQKSLENIEENLQQARRYYNGTVRNYNIKVASVPAALIASLSGFKKAPYFELSNDKERNNPGVSF